MVDTPLEDVMSEQGAEKVYNRLAEMAQKYAAQLIELDEQKSAY